MISLACVITSFLVKPNKPNITVEDRYQVETVVDYKKAPYVRLLSSNVNSHKIDINFD